MAKAAAPPVVTTKTGAATKPATSPVPGLPANILSLIGTDPQFMATNSELGQALTDYLAEAGLRKTQYGVQYAQDIANLAKEKKQTVQDTARSYAARGLIRGSGLYNQAKAKYNEAFTTRETGLKTAKTNFEANQNLALTQLQNQQAAAKKQAIIAAAGRRAAKLGMIL
jgi:hypothetical protein